MNLDPLARIEAPHPLATTPAEFVRACFVALSTLPLTRWQRTQLCAIFWLETQHGTNVGYAANNLGGVKPKSDFLVAYHRETGHSMPWWEQGGHVESGDSPIVRYMGFDSREQFVRIFAAHYLGAPHVPPFNPAYDDTAHEFRTESRGFVDALLRVGYRGDDSNAEHHAAKVALHWKLVAEIEKLASAVP
jgi:hypothetical protein